MATFQSSEQVSSFPSQNILYNSAAGITAQGLRTNELLNQGRQLDVSNANMEQVGRAAAGLLDPSQYPDEASRAAAYPRIVGLLQSQGYALHAPAQYPGEGVLRQLVSASVPLKDQISTGMYTTPQAQANYNRVFGTNQPAPTAGTTATPGAAPSGAGTATIGQRQNNPGNLTFAGQPGASPGQGNRFASFPDMPTGVAATANQLALYQEQHGINTVRGAVTRWVSDPKADLTSYTADVAKALGVGPDDPIDLTNPDVQAKFIQAQFPHESAGGGYVLNPADVAKGVQMAAANRGRTVQAPGTAVGAVPRRVQVAGATPTVATDGTTAPPGAPTAAVAASGATTAAAPPAATPTPATTPSTGTASPQFQRAMQLERQAAMLEAGPGGQLPQNKVMADYLHTQAKAILAADSWVQQPDGSYRQAITGEPKDAPKPLPHYVYDATQHAYIDTTGTTKPEFEPAQRDSAVAQRDVMELGPLVANGKATPQQQARYATAVETYRQPVLRENPVTKETVRVNTRELPAGFPEPPALGGGGAPGGAAPAGGANVVMPGLSPQQQQIERDPAAYEVAKSQYERNAKEIDAIGDAGRQAQADQIRIKEMQDVLQKFNSGRGTEAATAAAAWFNSWAPAALTGWQKEAANLSGSQAAEAFSKLALVGAGTQERSVLGARGGYQAIKLFKEANPNINLQDATNKSILDMQLISNQANADYSQAALSHFADNETKFAQTHKYESLQQFDRNWNAQRNPQVYSAAMGAISGQPASQWAKGLSDDEYTRALQMVQRAKPSAVVNTKNGPYSMQPNAVTTGTSAAPGTKVIRFDHNGNVIQ